jgi:hypothetical protein
LLGGRIEVQSQLGQGSGESSPYLRSVADRLVFRFFVKTSAVASPTAISVSSPADRESPTPTSIATTATPSPSLTAASATSSATSISASDIVTTGSPPPDGIADLHILIVEDNIINQTVLKRQITKAGLTCDGESRDNGLRAVS